MCFESFRNVLERCNWTDALKSFEHNNFDDIEKSNMIKAMGNVSYFLCEQKDQYQHMQLLSLVSIIDIACVNKEVIHTFLLNAVFLDSMMSKLVLVMPGHIPQIIYHR